DHRRGHGSRVNDELIRTRRRGPDISVRSRRSFARLRLAAIGGERGGEVHPTRDPHPLTFMLDFDLGEAGLLEKRRKLANEVLVHGGLFLGHRWRPLPSRINGAWPRASWQAPRWQGHSFVPRSRRSRPSRPWRCRSAGGTAHG